MIRKFEKIYYSNTYIKFIFIYLPPMRDHSSEEDLPAYYPTNHSSIHHRGYIYFRNIDPAMWNDFVFSKLES